MITPLLIVILVGLFILITAPLVIFPCILASKRNQDEVENWETKSQPVTENVIFVLDKSDILREIIQDG